MAHIADCKVKSRYPSHGMAFVIVRSQTVPVGDGSQPLIMPLPLTQFFSAGRLSSSGIAPKRQKVQHPIQAQERGALI
jgi:hypothetical protein